MTSRAIWGEISASAEQREPYGTQQRQVDAGRQRAIFPIVGSGAVPATLDQFVVNLRGYSSMAPPTARRWSRKLKEGSFSRFVR